jgi:hypothetical protein
VFVACDEEVLVETFVAQALVEAFDQAVLHWLARRNVMPFNACVLLPAEDGI